MTDFAKLEPLQFMTQFRDPAFWLMLVACGYYASKDRESSVLGVTFMGAAVGLITSFNASIIPTMVIGAGSACFLGSMFNYASGRCRFLPIDVFSFNLVR